MQSTLYPLMPIPFKPPRLVATPPVVSAEQCALLKAAMLHEVLGHIGAMDVCHPVVVYCLYGYQVSAQATGLLSEKGFDARRLSGGITAWHALGGQTEKIQ